MTKDEYNEAAALVVRLRKDLELHTDALVKSNAQCADYHKRIERLAADLTASNAERDTLHNYAEKLHSELVEVRAALASATEQRDSCRRTLYEWERADTKPHERVTADDVADHVVPPVLNRGEPDPANDPKDAELEFRNVVPTPEMLKVCSWWEVQGRADVICFKNNDQRPVVWRSLRGDASWQYEDCPQPLKPSKRTWKALDALLADHVVPPVLPMCTTCHGCGMPLGKSAQGPYYWCQNVQCTKKTTQYKDHDASPYWGLCKSSTPVRHE